MKTIWTIGTLAAGFAVSPTFAQASTVQTTMAVTATNANSCAVAALPLAFGTINQISGTVTDTTTTITVTCSPGVAYNVGLDNGTHASGGVRNMQSALNGSSTISYGIFSDAARTVAWGNTVNTDTVGRTATVTPATLTVYGRIPANTPAVVSGIYADLVTVTVSF